MLNVVVIVLICSCTQCCCTVDDLMGGMGFVGHGARCYWSSTPVHHRNNMRVEGHADVVVVVFGCIYLALLAHVCLCCCCCFGGRTEICCSLLLSDFICPLT
jgi:hypothetical protein